MLNAILYLEGKLSQIVYQLKEVLSRDKNAPTKKMMVMNENDLRKNI